MKGFRAILCMKNEAELVLMSDMIREYKPRTHSEKLMQKEFLNEINELRTSAGMKKVE